MQKCLFFSLSRWIIIPARANRREDDDVHGSAFHRLSVGSNHGEISFTFLSAAAAAAVSTDGRRRRMMMRFAFGFGFGFGFAVASHG
jgi:hypothetical protein